MHIVVYHISRPPASTPTSKYHYKWSSQYPSVIQPHVEINSIIAESCSARVKTKHRGPVDPSEYTTRLHRYGTLSIAVLHNGKYSLLAKHVLSKTALIIPYFDGVALHTSQRPYHPFPGAPTAVTATTQGSVVPIWGAIKRIIYGTT